MVISEKGVSLYKFFIFLIILVTYSFFFYVWHLKVESIEKANSLALIIAHRGAVDQFNENTIEAYEQSIKDGADWIEIDLRMTSDGVLIPMHDVDIDRTTTGTGEVNDLTWEQISRFQTVKNNYLAPIPSLEEVLQTFGKNMNYYIETRLVNGHPLMELKLVLLLKKYDLLRNGHITIASFDKQSLKKVNELEQSIPLILLYRNGDFSLEDAINNNYEVIGLESKIVTNEVVKKLHDAGKKVQVYFNTPSIEKNEQRRMQTLLIDGYITNDVGYTRNLLGR